MYQIKKKSFSIYPPPRGWQYWRIKFKSRSYRIEYICPKMFDQWPLTLWPQKKSSRHRTDIFWSAKKFSLWPYSYDLKSIMMMYTSYRLHVYKFSCPSCKGFSRYQADNIFYVLCSLTRPWPDLKIKNAIYSLGATRISLVWCLFWAKG